jgi:1-phosphofructokinase family hexose kinase
MILTVTLNPLLERRYYYQSLDLSSVNRNGKLIIKAGGKGINVNRQLNKLGIKNIALLFTGGTNGKLIRETLRAEKINFSEIITRNDTRDAALIIDGSAEKIYSFFGTDTSVSSKEANDFIEKMEKAIAACEIVVFSGSSPCKEIDSIFVEGINIANKLDKISLCDTYGSHLQDCLDSSPTIIHNNVDEIKSSLGLSLESETDHLNFLKLHYEKGVKQAYITDIGNSFYASNFDFHYKVTPAEISAVDSTGSGDAFVAGIVYGWHNKFTFEQQLRFATTLGAINAKSFEVCDVEMKDAESLAQKIKIESIGKKPKVINDHPG